MNSKYKNVKFEDGEWWYYGNKDGNRRRLSSHIKKNKKRMFVGGKYIPVNHPWHKSGSYRTYNDVAFENLSSRQEIKSGYIYIIKNPAWDGWLKIGRAIDANDRLKNFQTYSPFRDFKISKSFNVDDQRQAENNIHKLFNYKFKHKKEWYLVDEATAIKLIEGYLNEKA